MSKKTNWPWWARAQLWWFKRRPEILWWSFTIATGWWVLSAIMVSILGLKYKIETKEPAFFALALGCLCYFWTTRFQKYMDNKFERMRLEAFHEATLERRFGRLGRGTEGETPKKEE